MSPCFGMPVPPAVSCFLSRPFHSLSTGPFNGLGACRATRQREAPPHAKCIRIEVRISAIVSARSRTKVENARYRASLGEQYAKAISDVERKKRRRRAQVRRPGDRYHRALLYRELKKKKKREKKKKERVNETTGGERRKTTQHLDVTVSSAI